MKNFLLAAAIAFTPFSIDEIGLAAWATETTGTLNVHQRSTCSSVDITPQSDVATAVSFGVENTVSAWNDISPSTSDNLYYSTDGGSTWVLLAQSAWSLYPSWYAPFDGRQDCAGTSGATYTASRSYAGSAHITDSSVCALFVGSGTCPVKFKYTSSKSVGSTYPCYTGDWNHVSGHIDVTVNP